MSKYPLVLTGISGFLGSAVQRQAMQSGNYQLNGLIHKNTNIEFHSQINYQVGDIEHIPPSLFPEKPFVLIHLAIKQIDHDNTGFKSTNIDKLERLLSGLPPQCAGIIYSSSMSVYGQGEKILIDESAPLNPFTELAKTRLCAEKKIQKYAITYDKNVYLLRPRFIIGQGDLHTLPSWQRVANGFVYWGHAQNNYSIFDVDDYANIMLQLVEKILDRDRKSKPDNLALNVAYHKPISNIELYKTIRRFENLHHPYVRLAFPERLINYIRNNSPTRLAKKITSLELINYSQYASINRLESLGLKVDLNQAPVKVLNQSLWVNSKNNKAQTSYVKGKSK